ncbi:MAG: adenine phosphoribosyltransferase [Candidatus Woesearchaeota archaeon]
MNVIEDETKANVEEENVVELDKIESEEVEQNKEFDLKYTIRTVANWPKPGIMFRDITTLLQNPKAFNHCIQKFKDRYSKQNISKIAGIESRGFIFGAALARELNLPFVLIRKKGKLPAETISHEYALEYGTDTIEIHKDAISVGENVLIIDDLIATSGTLNAACKLVEKLGGKVYECALVIELLDLNGREKMKDYKVFSLIQFEGK